MVAVAAMFVVPIVGFIAMAFRDQNNVAAGSDGFLGLGGLSWDNVVYSWDQITRFGPAGGGLFQRWILNSLQLAVVGGILALVAALPAGYALARLRFRWRKIWLFATLLAMVMPNTVLVIPLFLEVNAIGAVGQLWPVAVIMGFFPFGVYLSYIHFMTTMPPELVEAARIDGLGELAIFFRIGLPISKQAIALVAFFSFELIGASPLFNATVAAGLDVKLYMPQLALATVISMVPLLIVFLGAQRFLVRGQTVGAVKG
ncbi:hypothetical protein LUZ63_021109 [Rhynchospora breviuscula]|uniref:ABC transmembrane type-1 domain-containing protein n=1 Tax=Rhynchospora breviuscula TaxID=2022672 RepID=A0A9P9Z787_9POAL|nr:hypothetical protein LUZ63_021109 [Rhynchospora breviuscula]